MLANSIVVCITVFETKKFEVLLFHSDVYSPHGGQQGGEVVPDYTVIGAEITPHPRTLTRTTHMERVPRRKTGGVNQPAIHLILPPKWSRRQDHLWGRYPRMFEARRSNSEYTLRFPVAEAEFVQLGRGEFDLSSLEVWGIYRFSFGSEASPRRSGQ